VNGSYKFSDGLALRKVIYPALKEQLEQNLSDFMTEMDLEFKSTRRVNSEEAKQRKFKAVLNKVTEKMAVEVMQSLAMSNFISDVVTAPMDTPKCGVNSEYKVRPGVIRQLEAAVARATARAMSSAALRSRLSKLNTVDKNVIASYSFDPPVDDDFYRALLLTKTCEWSVSPSRAVVGTLKSVCDDYNITISELMGHSRLASFVRARQQVMYYLSTHFGWPSTHIGQLIGGRDRKTVSHGIQAHAKRLEMRQIQSVAHG